MYLYLRHRSWAELREQEEGMLNEILERRESKSGDLQ